MFSSHLEVIYFLSGKMKKEEIEQLDEICA